MKKLALSIVVSFFVINSFSQSYYFSRYHLGNTKEAIKIAMRGFPMGEGIDGDGIPYLYFIDDKARTVFAYIFNRSNRCIKVVISPADNNSTSAWIRLFNEDYAKINNNKWRCNPNGDSFIIELLKYDSGDSYFEVREQ